MCRLPVAALITAALPVMQAAAAPTFFVEANVFPAVDAGRDAAFQAAITTSLTELPLDNIPSGTEVSNISTVVTAISVDLLDPAGAGAEMFFGSYASGGGAFGTVSGGALLNRAPGVSMAGAMRFTFNPPVEAFGAWVFDDLGPGGDETSFTLTVVEVGGVMTTSPALSGGNGGSFFVEGFIGARSDTAIEQAIITTSDPGDFFEVDHLQIGAVFPDEGDADGIPDAIDNCIFYPNPAQIDSDGDGYGNACDTDLNNDCVTNALDLGLFRSVFFSDHPDADFNGDGTVNPIDLGILRFNFFQPPGPSGLTMTCN